MADAYDFDCMSCATVLARAVEMEGEGAATTGSATFALGAIVFLTLVLTLFAESGS